MYVNKNATVVERNTQVPVNFSLPSNLLGKVDDWKLTLVNKSDSTIKLLNGYTVREIGEFVTRGTIQGAYSQGVMTIKVDDSTVFAEGQTIRIDNNTYNVIEVAPANHLLVLDKPLQEDVSNLTPVKLVTYPHLLGLYVIEGITIDTVGQFLLIISDNKKEVKNIITELEVVVTLQSAVANGQIHADIISSGIVG